MIKFIPQCKGKDISDVPASKLLKSGWYYGIKYDGNYVQIHKELGVIRFFTSGGEEFYLPEVADELLLYSDDFIIECEYIAESLGRLGDRRKAAKLTTYRTEFKKGIRSKAVIGRDTFKVFDVIDLTKSFKDRKDFLTLFRKGDFCNPVSYSIPMDLDKTISETFTRMGYEGIFFKHETHMYLPGKRVNLGIKDKGSRPTADLLCIDVIGGTGKYHGQVGSLELRDVSGRLVSVGSGLSDSDRAKPYDYYIGKTIEIAYEQILITYIQPTFICVREDK